MRRTTMTAVALTAVLACVAVVALAMPARAEGADFAVSLPAEPLVGEPGTVVPTWLGVSNRTGRPGQFDVRTVSLFPGVDGTFEVVDEPDPVWADAVDPPPSVRLAAGEYRRIPLTLRIPDVDPNVYIVGLAVEAVQRREAAVTVRSRIVTHLEIDVPGPRATRLSAAWQRVPRLTVGRSVTGAFQVRNDGAGAARIRGQVRMDRVWRATNAAVIQATGEEPALLPGGAAKTVPYHWQAGGPWFLGRPNLELSYADGSPSLSSSRLVGPLMLVLPLETLAVLGAVALLASSRRLTRLWGRRRGLSGHPLSGHPWSRQTMTPEPDRAGLT